MPMNFDALRQELKTVCETAYFTTSSGEALMDSVNAETVSEEELLEMAGRWGLDLTKFEE